MAQSSKNDSVENRSVRAIIQEELQLFAPKLTRSLNDVINGNTEKTVKEAVHLYSEVTAKSQKKVIEDLSTAQASENVISKVNVLSWHLYNQGPTSFDSWSSFFPYIY